MRSHTASTTHSGKKHSAASTIHSNKKETRCHESDPLLPVEMVEHLRKGIGSAWQIVHVEDIGARKAVQVEVPQELSENMRSALHRIGITQLYSHQAESIQASFTGKNVVVATMTSSGKSLCYNLPVIEALSQSSSSCALYLFPTKALAQDQLRAFSAMTKGFSDSLNVGIYDGDTNQKERTRLRQDALVSLWVFTKALRSANWSHLPPLPIEEVFDLFCEGISFAGPFWDHVLGYWKASLETPNKVLFLKYEDMKIDTQCLVKRLADFMGHSFSFEEERQGVVQEIIKLCSFQNLTSLEVNKRAGNKEFFRRGEVGDSKKHLTPQMLKRLEEITEQKLSRVGEKLKLSFNLFVVSRFQLLVNLMVAIECKNKTT